MAPQKTGTAGGEDIGGHDAESSFSQFSIMTCTYASIATQKGPSSIFLKIRNNRAGN
jgi:hypothetical protein